MKSLKASGRTWDRHVIRKCGRPAGKTDDTKVTWAIGNECGDYFYESSPRAPTKPIPRSDWLLGNEERDRDRDPHVVRLLNEEGKKSFISDLGADMQSLHITRRMRWLILPHFVKMTTFNTAFALPRHRDGWLSHAHRNAGLFTEMIPYSKFDFGRRTMKELGSLTEDTTATSELCTLMRVVAPVRAFADGLKRISA